ncbi:MAG: hypothetical protein ACSLFP_16650 [Acidimicrobiales bacterium]
MSRPKALLIAGLAAGALAVSSAAAAVNVGLLAGDDSTPFTPEPVATSSAPTETTVTTEPPVEVVYQDVYETVAPAPAPAPAVASPAVRSSSVDESDDSDDGYDDSDARYDDDGDDHDDDFDDEDDDFDDEDDDHDDDEFDD